jgi:sulfofructose kinase
VSAHDGVVTDRRGVPRVACAGIATLDHIFAVESLPIDDGKYSATGYLAIGGGVAANAAVTVARLGGAASFIGCVGDDVAGDQVLEEFAALDVATGSVQRVANRSTPTSVALVDRDGDRALVNYVAPDFFDRADPSFARDIGDAAVVLVDCRWPIGAIQALEAARHHGIHAVVDVDRPVDSDPVTDTGRILALATHLLYSCDALLGTTGEADVPTALAAAARRSAGWIAVTEGERGVSWLEGNDVRHLPALRVRAVDTLGAGDVFHGAFALALAEGRPEREAVRFASAAAAAKCTQAGGRAGIPDRAMVEALLEGTVDDGDRPRSQS